MPKPTPAFDPRSDRLVLRYVGDGRPLSDVPTRDLTENDLCRIAYQRSLASAATRPDPRTPDQAAVAAVRDELLARGQFVAAVPAEPAPTTEG